MSRGTTKPYYRREYNPEKASAFFATHERLYAAYEQIIGSTTERLGRLAQCAVLVVK